MSTQVMGTHGYAAPEYVATGELIDLLRITVITVACLAIFMKLNHFKSMILRLFHFAC